MPNKQAAKKAMRQTATHRVHNVEAKEAIRKLIKTTRKLADAKKTDEAVASLKATGKALDKAAQKKILKKNTVSRIKSRLAKTVASSK